MALKSPYCTIQEADAYLANNTDWLSLFDDQKNSHLTNARYFIDSMYTCNGLDETTPQDEFKYANAELAAYDMAESIYTVSENDGVAMTYKQVKAGSVETTKEYSRYNNGGTQNIIDNFPKITAVLSEYCDLTGNNRSSISTAYLTRN